jgi:hypothetical protein
MEPKETLADCVMQLTHDWSHLVGPVKRRAALDQLWKPEMLRTRKAIQQAERFTFDHQFLAQVIRMSNTGPHNVLRMTAFANLPFDKVWIEFDQNFRVDTNVAMGTTRNPRDEDIGMGGFLVERTDKEPDVWMAMWFQGLAKDRQKAYCGQCSYAFSARGDLLHDALDKHILIDEKKEWAPYWRDAWGYIGAASEAHKALAYARLTSMGGTLPFSRLHKPLLTAEAIDVNDYYQTAKNMAHEGRGDLRFIVTALAMINLVPIEYEYKPSAGRYTRRLKNFDYLSHRSIRIIVGKKRIETVVDRAMSHEAMRKKRHKVRGHYRHYNRGKVNESIIWIETHERGDATLGFVTHSYSVTSEQKGAGLVG